MTRIPIFGGYDLPMDGDFAIIGCGSRDWHDTSGTTVSGRIGRFPIGRTVVIHGDSGNADLWISRYAKGNGYVEVPVPYFDWLGKRGGPERNRVMLHILLAFAKRGRMVCVEAFHKGDSRGTKDMMGQAKAAGVQVFATRPTATGGFETMEEEAA